jgi:cytochrome c1
MQDEGPLGRYITIFQSLFRSHPFPIWRTKEVIDWVSTGNFLEMLDGEYKKRALVATTTCPACHASNKVGALVCSSCGHQLVEDLKGEAAEEVMREAKRAAGGEDGVQKTWRDVQKWYRRNFTIHDPDDDNAMDGESKRKDE